MYRRTTHGITITYADEYLGRLTAREVTTATVGGE